MTQKKKELGDPFDRPAPTIIGKKKEKVEDHLTTLPQSHTEGSVADDPMIRTNIYIPRSLKKWVKKYATDVDEDMSGVIIKLLEDLKAKVEQQ